MTRNALNKETQETGQSFVIFATSHLTRLQAVERIKGFTANVLTGCYKGREETSFICNRKYLRSLHALGVLEGEESILHLEPFDHETQGRKAALDFLKTGIVKSVGLFKQTTEAKARACDNWTKDNKTGYYYTTI